MTYSTLVALHAPHLPLNGTAEPDNERSRLAQATIEQIIEKIKEKLVKLRCFILQDHVEISPWALFFAYHVCGMMLSSPRADDLSAEVLRTVLEAFRTIDVRWNAGGT